MTSIGSFVTLFTATFALVFGYLTFSEQEIALMETAASAVSVSELAR